MTTYEDDGEADRQVYESSDDLEVNSNKTASVDNIDNSWFGKTKRIVRTAYKGARSLVGLVVILLLYSILGALLFMAIESRHEQKYKTNIIDIRTDMLNELEQHYGKHTNITEWRMATERSLKIYEDSVRESINNNVNSNSTVEVWTIWSSIFFVFTVYTTIGYGNLAPVTGFGRLLCILYAGIGIPLCLLLFAELGKQFTVSLKYLWAFVRRSYYTGYLRRVRDKIPFHRKYQLNDDPATLEPKAEDGEQRSRSGSRLVYGYEVDSEFNLPMSVAVAILFGYILIGAIMYMFWEDWGFIESIYFVFISLSTIGFGDVLPAHPKFFVISSVYVFIGLSLVSMCINVAIVFFNSAAYRARQKMGQAKKKLGNKVNQAHKNAKEKAATMKTNITDGTLKFKQKTDERISNLKSNIVDETTKLKQKTDEKLSGIKSNINEETTKFRKKADEKFRRKSTMGQNGVKEQNTPEKQLKVPNDDNYEVIGKIVIQSMDENKL